MNILNKKEVWDIFVSDGSFLETENLKQMKYSQQNRQNKKCRKYNMTVQ